MRLAYLSADPGIAFGGTKGAAVHMGELTRAFSAIGLDVLLLASGRAPDATPPDGVKVEILPGPGKGSSTADRLAAEGARAEWLEARLAEFAADVLYERLALHSSAGARAAATVGVPHLVELNAPLPAEAERYRTLDHATVADRLERTVLGNADVVLPVSSPLADYARSRGARRVEVVPNAVALERFAEAPRAAEPPVVVFTGSLRPWHGVDTIVEAWALLGSNAPELLVVGDGPGRPLLEAAGARTTGAVPHAQVPALLASAQIGLAPYALDAPDYFSPIKLFEYLAAGLATVAADLPGVRDVVSPGIGILVPRGDAAALADAVASLASNPTRRERLGRAGRAVVAACHTWEHRARTIVELTDEVRAADLVVHRKQVGR